MIIPNYRHQSHMLANILSMMIPNHRHQSHILANVLSMIPNHRHLSRILANIPPSILSTVQSHIFIHFSWPDFSGWSTPSCLKGMLQVCTLQMRTTFFVESRAQSIFRGIPKGLLRCWGLCHIWISWTSCKYESSREKWKCSDCDIFRCGTTWYYICIRFHVVLQKEVIIFHFHVANIFRFHNFKTWLSSSNQ